MQANFRDERCGPKSRVVPDELAALLGRHATSVPDAAQITILYPPVALWLFVPFALLPTIPALILWWGLPAAIVTMVIVRLRPRAAVWPLMALCLAWPTTPLKIWTGNPVIWCMAVMAVATLWRGAAAFVLLKPSLAPFAFFGIHRREWWVGFAALVALSLPFTTMWLDWAATVADSRGGGFLYSALEAPMLSLPLVAWLGRDAAPRARCRRAVHP